MIPAIVPCPPSWKPSWELAERIVPVAAMSACAQHPDYHAEGDVWTHTMMACDEMAGDQEWRDLPEADRQTTFLALLFHDVGKPGTTTGEGKGIESRGHSVLGSRIARERLYVAGMAAPEREPIVSMVRYHGYPIMFLEKQDPERAVATACASCDPRLLAMVAKFDARGRKISFGRAARKEEMESRAQFFHEVALGLLACPMSAHSRFLYFHTGKPAYDAYDDSRAEAIVMSGLPGAGKDTWIRRNGAGMPTVSLDNIRYEMDVDPDDNQGHVVAAAKEMARGLLRQGRPFIWNATNVSKMIRHGLISLFWSYKYRTKIIYVEAPWDEVMRRNQAREKIVPRKILEHLLGRLEVPDKTEAHEVAWTS